MDDKELLEKAAKAAEIEGEYRTEHLCVNGDWLDVTAIFLEDDGWWNPLEDDGDALWLAVTLRITPHIDGNMTEAEAATQAEDGFFGEPHIDDPYAATRRAIVRAAAALADREPPNVRAKRV